MQIKKYTAPTLKEAAIMMKEELGSESIILGSRLIEGDAAAGKRKMFEITVGYDKSENTEPKNRRSDKQEAPGDKSFAGEISLLSDKVYHRSASSDMNKNTADGKAVAARKVDPAADESSILRELNEISDILEHRDVQKNIISVILSQVKQYGKYLHSSNIDSYVISAIESMIPTRNFELHKNKGTKVVAVVGPTGVGKTTCIAKLAVIAKILHNLDVGLISIDTYRLGAIDQLRIFSEVSNIDMLVAYQPEEMPELMKSFKDKDIVFIDTAGRSQKRTDQLENIKEYFAAIDIDETFLVLSSTGSTKNLYDTAENFRIFDYDSFIFTKLDEGIVFGNILNLVTNYNVPVTFLSNGQIIPDDIMSANSEYLSKLIYKVKAEK